MRPSFQLSMHAHLLTSFFSARFLGVLMLLPGFASGSLVAQCGPTWLPGSPHAGPNGSVNAVGLCDPDGAGPQRMQLAVGGLFYAAGSSAVANIALWDPSTNLWSPVGSGVGGQVEAVLGLGNGGLVAGGTFTTAGGGAASSPPLRARIGDLAAVSDLVARWSFLRVVLGVLAVEVIVLSARDLVVPGPSGHDTRHLAAFTLAYGVLLTVVTIRPSRAPAALPAAAVLGGALAITAVVDLAAGRVPLVGEALHLPELVSVFVLWRMARPRRAPALRIRRRGAARTPQPVESVRPR